MSLLKRIAAVLSVVPTARRLRSLAWADLDGSGKSAAEVRAERLRSTGVPATATVLAIEDTGATMSNNPMVRMRLRVEVADGTVAAFEADKTAFVSRIAVPRVGDRLPAFVDAGNPADWTFAPGALGSVRPGRIGIVWQGPPRREHF